MKTKSTKISYEPEADVLRIEIAKRPLYDTLEMGNFIIYIDKNGKPIYLKILRAKNFLLQSNQALLKKLEISYR
jgi:uncharacterized protein YuzE